MALFFFITCKSTTRKTIFEVPTTYATDAYYSVFKPESLVEYSLISVQSIWVLYVLKMYYKSYRMGDLSELLLLLIPSLLNPKFCFRLFLVQSVYDINIFFLLYSLIEIVTIMNGGTICCFEKAAGTMEAVYKWSE